VLQWIAVCRSMSQCVAVCLSVLQCVAVCLRVCQSASASECVREDARERALVHARERATDLIPLQGVRGRESENEQAGV